MSRLARIARPLTGIAAFLRQLSLFDPPAAPEPFPQPSLPAQGETAVRDARQPSVTRSAAAADGTGMPIPAGARGIAVRPGPARVTATDGPAAPGSLLPPASPFAGLLQGPYARIEVVPKPRLHESWRVTWIRRSESLRLEIPALLAESPRETKVALLEWALLASRRGRKGTEERKRRAELESAIRAALQAPGTSPAGRRRAARDGRRLARLNPKGSVHDLEPVFAAVNARYFGGALEARITWSARFGGLSTHTLARDPEGREYHLLTISRGYDDPEVTPEILGGVVYHECLHIAIPPRRSGGRRIVHGADFRAREREYEHYQAWRAWHRDGLPKALRRARRRMRG